MLKKIGSILKWIWWNSANIISIGRAVGTFWVFFITDFSDERKLLWYFLLLCTDKLDGWVARLVKNTEGIGKIIDPASDKADKFMFLIFFINSEIMNTGILSMTGIKAIFSGEVVIVSIVLLGIYFSLEHQKSRTNQQAMSWSKCRAALRESRGKILMGWKSELIRKAVMVAYDFRAVAVYLRKKAALSWSNYKVMLKKSKEEILLKWKVELIGKAVMAAYAVMVLMLYFNKKAIWRADITELICVSALIVGLIARAVSIVIYAINVYKGQKEMSEGG